MRRADADNCISLYIYMGFYKDIIAGERNLSEESYIAIQFYFKAIKVLLHYNRKNVNLIKELQFFKELNYEKE